MLADLSVLSKQITLWRSSKAVKKWVQFRENSANPELARKIFQYLEDIMNKMRKDLGLKRTKKGNLLAFFVNDIKQAIKSINNSLLLSISCLLPKNSGALHTNR